MPGSDLAEPTRAVRAFNRFYTSRVGALGPAYLHTAYSLTESRVLFELAQHDVCEVVDVRRRLGIDASYVSRILATFESAGLVRRERSTLDARRQVTALTERGRAVFADLDSRATDLARGLLSDLSDDDLARLVGAMDTIQGILGDASTSEPPGDAADRLVLRSLLPGDLGWVVQVNARVYTQEYGWDASYEALVARIVADYIDGRDPTREDAWIAEVDGRMAGAVMCVRKDDETAQLRLLIVDPAARGHGVGTRLVDECIQFAQRSGYRRMVLWTNDVLAQARRIYQRAGFELETEEPHHSFGHDLVGQWWSLDLRTT